MNYVQFEKDLLDRGYRRVERDDRLLDILSGQTRGKGVELWDKWSESTVEFVRLSLPYRENGWYGYTLYRGEVEQALLCQKSIDLEAAPKN